MYHGIKLQNQDIFLTHFYILFEWKKTKKKQTEQKTSHSFVATLKYIHIISLIKWKWVSCFVQGGNIEQCQTERCSIFPSERVSFELRIERVCFHVFYSIPFYWFIITKKSKYIAAPQILRAFRARGGLSETLVASVIDTMFKPAMCNPVIEEARPGPRPLTTTRTVWMPFARLSWNEWRRI